MDYAAFATLATTMINDAGREVTFNRFAQGAADTDKPWQGPSPSAEPDATDDVAAAFVGGAGLSIRTVDKELLKKTEKVALVGPGASFDLATANEVVDGSVKYRVLWVETLKPGDTVVLYMVGVAR